jgi:uncharacterized MAPEG superfamily protein
MTVAQEKLRQREGSQVMTTEIAMAAVIALLGIVQVSLAAIEYRRVHGIHYANTARDTPSGRVDSVLLGRLSRAQANLMETAPYFIGLALIISVASISTEWTRGAALVFAGARILHLPLYALGVPYLRGLVWTVSFIALLAIAFAALGAVDWVETLRL